MIPRQHQAGGKDRAAFYIVSINTKTSAKPVRWRRKKPRIDFIATFYLYAATGPASLAGPFVLAPWPVRMDPFVVHAAAADHSDRAPRRYQAQRNSGRVSKIPRSWRGNALSGSVIMFQSNEAPIPSAWVIFRQIQERAFPTVRRSRP